MLAMATVLHASDPDLPKPLDATVAQGLITNPPFTRALNLSDSLQLTGVASVGGKPVATIKDRSTGKSYVVTDVPNERGWKLAEVTPATEIKRSEVRIYVGSELVSIRYKDAMPAPVKPGSYMPSKIPTKEEYTGKDEKGEYVRGMPYLTDDDRNRFREVPREIREKFLNVVHDHRDMLFKASHEERAAFVKKVYDSVMPR